MHYEVVEDPELDFIERLRMEVGWGDVGKGLSQILFGYGAFVLGILVGFGLVALALYDVGADAGRKMAKPSNATMWKLYIGLGVLSVIGLISYMIVVGGQFKCMLYASERNGARWFMFMSIACLFLGPAFEVATGISNWQAVSELKKHPGKLQDFQLNPLGQWLHLVAFAIGMLYPLCFTLFLRAIAVCLRATGHVMLVNGFLILAAGVAGATAYSLYKHPPGAIPMPIGQALMLGCGWGVMLLLYAVLIGVMRGCIISVMGQLKSPLES